MRKATMTKGSPPQQQVNDRGALGEMILRFATLDAGSTEVIAQYIGLLDRR
jgi:hypothetical protein